MEMFTDPYGLVDNEHVEKAKQAVVDFYHDLWENEIEELKAKEPEKTFERAHIDKSWVLIVWASKTLDHWKVIATTKMQDGRLFEVTYNGAKRETYVDEYMKISNTVVTKS